MVRAGIPQASWVELKQLPPLRQAQAKALLSGETIGRLESASVMTWVPFEVEAQLADAVFDVLGPAGARRFYHAKTINGFDMPFLRQAAGTTLRLFGVSPVAIIRMAARVWTLISQNAGRYDCIDQSAEGRAFAIMRGFPTPLYRRPEAWTESVLGGLQGLFEVFRMRVRVEADAVTPAETRFAVHWSPLAPTLPEGERTGSSKADRNAEG
jgi:hypothetical protein